MIPASLTVIVESANESARQQWKLTIPGAPVAKGRPRIGIVKGHAMAFTPQKTRSYESEIRHLAHEAWKPRALLEEIPVELSVWVFKAIPQSWSSKKHALAIAGKLRPLGKPDFDNYIKAVADALNSVVYRDDALIVDAHVHKWYATTPRLEIGLAW